MTRVEVIVLVAVVVVFCAIAYFPISNYLVQHSVSRAVQCGRTLSTLLSQYATDNNGVYPVGEGTPVVGKSEGIARNFLENNFIPDASIFAVGSTPVYSPKGQDYTDLGPADISWDFTAGAKTSAGITSDAPDLLPVVYTTGQEVDYPTKPGAGLDLPVTGNGPFGPKGMIVAYKNNSVAFLRSTTSGMVTVCPGFISSAISGTGTYTQIKP